MESRSLGTTGYRIGEVGLGTWNIGGEWGDVTDEEGREAVHTALDAGIDFIDTADVYGDGRSERLIREVLGERETDGDGGAGDHDAAPVVATKAGRQLDPHTADRYTPDNIRGFVDESRERLGVETLDLVQLHCPPTEVYYRPALFDALDDMVAEGRISHYGVSVEKAEEGIKAMEYDGVETVQIIFNPFRQRPAGTFLREAARHDVGVIVRVPLASGLLTDALDADTEFPENDHRNFNRDGDAFDVGETFAGVPFETGLAAADALETHVPDGVTLAQFSLRWILDHDAVSVVIPGSTSPDHIRDNVDTAALPRLSAETHARTRDVYDEYVHEHVHHRW